MATQEVTECEPPELPIDDISRAGVTAYDQDVLRYAQQDFDRPFSMTDVPKLRVRLLRLRPDLHILLVTSHHLVCDGSSVGILCRDLAEIYSAGVEGRPARLPELPIQYADYARWQRSQLTDSVLANDLSYWHQQLRGEMPVLELPPDRSRTVSDTHLGRPYHFEFSVPLTARLRLLAEAERASLYMVLLAIFQVLLKRTCGVDDVVVGTPVSDRGPAETESLIGLFLNTLVLRSDLGGDPTVRDLVTSVREVCLGAFAHRRLPFERLVRELRPERSPGTAPMFGTYFNFENTPMRAGQDSRFSLVTLDLPRPPAKFPLTVYGWEEHGRICFTFVYASDLYSRDRIACLAGQFQHLASQAVTDPDRRIGSLTLVTPETARNLPSLRQKIKAPAYPAAVASFRSWAERRPALVAVSDQGRSYTYGELWDRAAGIAAALARQGMGEAEVVVVSGQRSCGLYASMLAVLAAGGVLLTMDPRHPRSRQQDMLAQVKPRLFIWVGDSPGDSRVWPQGAGLIEVGADGLVSGVDLVGPSGPPAEIAAGSGPAYVFFTSGTTAAAHAVLGRHQGVAHFIAWQREQFGIGPGDRSAQLTGLSFNVLLRDVLTPLASGATLCVPGDPASMSGRQILSWLEQEEITMLHTVPSLAASWLADPPGGIGLASLRWVFFAGEPLTGHLIRRWREAFPRSGELVNLYGQTESSMAKCFSVVGRDADPGVQPVGRPIPHTQALVLREGFRPCGVGEVGEVYIRTPFLSLGYCNDPSLTSQRFPVNPARNDPDDRMFATGDRGRFRPDGTLEILGRTDRQLKILGVRIEPDEVAATIARCPGVSTCAVTATAAGDTVPRLTAYVVEAEPGQVGEAGLRSFLRRHLPAVMMPAVVNFLPSLPLTANGKIDWSALPEQPTAGAAAGDDHRQPSSQLETRLAHIWARLLGVESVGPDQDFFALGGHSLLAIELVATITEQLGLELDPGDFFADPTISAVARQLEVRRTNDQPGAADTQSGTAVVPLPARP